MPPLGGLFYCSDQDAVAVVHLMLDDLGGPAGVGLQPGLEVQILIADLDLLEAFGFPGAAQQGQTALLGFVFPGGGNDLRIQHQGEILSVGKDDDPFGHTDHIGGHADTGGPVGGDGVQQILGNGQVVGSGIGAFSGEEQGIVDQFTDHGRIILS